MNLLKNLEMKKKELIIHGKLKKTIMNEQWTLINNKIPKMLSKFCDKITDDKNKLITENVNLATELQLRKIQITEYKTQIDNQNKIIAGLFEKNSLLETA